MSGPIETHGLGKRYGKQWVLRKCEFTVAEGSFTALIGPNGAGKTTLLHIAVGLAFPSEGDVRVFGMNPHRDAAKVLPRIGFVGQSRPMYGRLSVDEMCRAAAALNPVWDRDYATRQLARLAINPKQKTGKLSGGQQAQVALILALAKRPELLILDEPTANLDPVNRRELLQVLMDAAMEQGATVLISSHNIADVERICDHVAIMKGGRIRHAEPLDAFVAGHRLVVVGGAGNLAIPATREVIHVSKHERQTVALVRTAGVIDATQGEIRDVALEEIVLGYLARESFEDHTTELAS